MSDIGAVIFLLILVIVIFRFRKYFLTELRYKFYYIQKEFERNPSYKNVFIFREPGQLKTEGRICAEFNCYHVSIQITGDRILKISLNTYTLGDNQPAVLIIWEPVYIKYNAINHIAEHLVKQTSDVLLMESNTKYDGFTQSVSYKREIPIQKRREYDRDLDSWFRSTHNYYD